MRLRGLGAMVSLTLLAIPLGAGEAATAAHPRLAATGVLVDGNRGGRDEIDVHSDTRQLGSAVVRFTSGVTARVPVRTRSMRAAVFVTTNVSEQRATGYLWAPATARSERSQVTLKPRAGSGPVVRVHSGAIPSVTITGLAPGTNSVQIITSGAGQALLQDTAPCFKHGAAKYATTTWISQTTVRFSDGLTPTSLKGATVTGGGTLCGKEPPGVKTIDG
jgi:hypothetical protein